MKAVLDVTTEFTSPNVSWILRGQAFRAQFPDRVQRLRAGLYVLVVRNDSPLPIYDRNGAGKIIVPANGGAVKTGKYESGLINRELTNFDHYHRRTGAGEEAGIFPTVMQLLLVADLTARRTETSTCWLRTVETALNRRFRDFLCTGEYGDQTQHGRSESRWLSARTPTKDELMRVFAEVLSAHAIT